MNCTHCGKPVELWPSAADRARKHGGTPQDYIALFPVHSDCQLKLREADTLELMRRVTGNTSFRMMEAARA